jgi:hypothetical protein
MTSYHRDMKERKRERRSVMELKRRHLQVSGLRATQLSQAKLQPQLRIRRDVCISMERKMKRTPTPLAAANPRYNTHELGTSITPSPASQPAS